MVKKAQNGTKATKDSTQYFKNEKELRLDLAINQSKFGLPKASKENAKKAVQAINDGARQAYKGKPGLVIGVHLPSVPLRLIEAVAF